METSVLMERTCKDCGAPLGPGREDRQYCDAGCRTNYNNRRRKEVQESGALLSTPECVTRIQEILLKNRSILESLCPEDDRISIQVRDLLGKGFNLKFFTSEAVAKSSGNVYRFCFEYGYSLDGDYALLVHREREVL